MILRLTIQATASQLAIILASLPEGAHVESAPVPMPPVAAPAVLPPVAAPAVLPIPAMPPVQASDDDDDNAPTDPNAPAVDSAGMPWDARIHAKTKATVADGTWRKRRNLDANVLAQVEAELKGAASAAPAPMAIPTAIPMQPPVPLAMPVPVMQPAPIPMPAVEPVVTAAVVPPMPVPEPQPQPVVPAPPPAPEPAPAPSGTLDFAQFMQHLAVQAAKRDETGAPVIHADYLSTLTAEINAAWSAHGITIASFTDIGTDQRLVDYAVQLLQRDGRW